MSLEKVWTVTALAVVSALLLSACGGDDSTDNATGATKTEAASPGLSAAQAVVKQYQQLSESEIGIKEKLKSPPPKGKTIVYLKCQVQECQEIYNGLQEAAKTVGWTAKAINVGFTPEDFNKSFQDALDLKPDGIISSGFPTAVYTALLNKAKSRGIPVVAFASGDTATGMDGNGLITTFNNGPQTSLYGKLVGNWIVADSGGKDAHVLTYSVAAYPTLAFYARTVRKVVTSQCSTCTEETINVQATDIGSKLPQQVVSNIQQNPKINYVTFGFGQMASGVRAALDAAGFKDVKIAGEGGEPSNLDALRQGKEQMWAAQPTSLQGYYGVDAFARFYTKTPLEPVVNALLPTAVLTKANVGDAKFSTVPDGPEHFKELWGV